MTARAGVAFRLAALPASHRPLVAEALAAAAAAGRLLLRHFRAPRGVRLKGVADVVTAADEECQALVARRLRRRFPDHGLLAEEGLDRGASAEWRWILDPLDGTKNFAHGLPEFCVSLAAERRGRVELGVVHDPVHRETFLAVRGRGAWRNGMPIRVSAVGELGRAFLGTGVPHRVRDFAAPLGRTFGRLAARSLGVRDRGAGALDLCYVACGRLDGYWEIDQSPWDIAAGGLMVQEAGGRMSDFRGGPFDIFGGQTVASNGRIHRQLLAVLALPGGFPKRYTPPQRRRP
ncbi:MAG: inositol monophosphatase [Candidatus Methylomirabilales bacterium]